MVKVYIYPAVTFTFPEIFIPYKRLLNYGHSILLLNDSANMAFNLKSRMEIVNTGNISQFNDILGFLN